MRVISISGVLFSILKAERNKRDTGLLSTTRARLREKQRIYSVKPTDLKKQRSLIHNTIIIDSCSLLSWLSVHNEYELLVISYLKLLYLTRQIAFALRFVGGDGHGPNN